MSKLDKRLFEARPKLDPKKSIDYTASDATTLVRLMTKGELSARTLIAEHLRRIDNVNPHLNAIAWPMFDEARRQAALVDERKNAGPLHGVPMTVKECFEVKETPATLGLTSRVGQVADSDSPLIKRLRNAGAILLGKTNLSHLMMLLETDNPVYGRTNNPWNLACTPGGSSGGEAAIVAAGGSALGLGTDIGGSVRIPAHFCGVAALKPTSGRLSMIGTGDLHHGQEAVLAQAGPIARSVADLDLAMSVLAAPGQESFDPTIAPVPWRDYRTVDVSTLRIGYYVNDGCFPCSPAVRRAVLESVAALRKRGAQLSEFEPPEIQTAMALFLALMSADGAASKKQLIGNGKVEKRIRYAIRFASLPKRVRALVGSAAELSGQRRLGNAARAYGRCSVSDYWQLVHRRNLYRIKFLSAMAAQQLDAVLCPPYALPALPHGMVRRLGPIHSHAVIFNLLGMPAGVVPITRVGAGEEGEREPSRDRVDRLAREAEQQTTGMPVGVQVAAPAWREDIVLAVMAQLENVFKFDTALSPKSIDRLGPGQYHPR